MAPARYWGLQGGPGPTAAALPAPLTPAILPLSLWPIDTPARCACEVQSAHPCPLTGKRGGKEAGAPEPVPQVLWEGLSKSRPHLAHWLPENTPGSPSGAPSSTLGLPVSPTAHTPPSLQLLLCALVFVAQTPSPGCGGQPRAHPATTTPRAPAAATGCCSLSRTGLAKAPIKSLAAWPLAAEGCTPSQGLPSRPAGDLAWGLCPHPPREHCWPALPRTPLTGPPLLSPGQGLLLTVGGRWPPGPHAVSPAPPATRRARHRPQDPGTLSA